MDYDPQNGRPYYYHETSGEVSWTKPGEEWSLSWDSISGQQYWIDRWGNIVPLQPPPSSSSSSMLVAPLQPPPSSSSGGAPAPAPREGGAPPAPTSSRPLVKSATGRLDWFRSNKDEIFDGSTMREQQYNNEQTRLYTAEEEARFQQNLLAGGGPTGSRPLAPGGGASASPGAGLSAVLPGDDPRGRESRGSFHDSRGPERGLEHSDVIAPTAAQLRRQAEARASTPRKEVSAAMIPSKRSVTPRGTPRGRDGARTPPVLTPRGGQLAGRTTSSTTSELHQQSTGLHDQTSSWQAAGAARRAAMSPGGSLGVTTPTAGRPQKYGANGAQLHLLPGDATPVGARTPTDSQSLTPRTFPVGDVVGGRWTTTALPMMDGSATTPAGGALTPVGQRTPSTPTALTTPIVSPSGRRYAVTK